MKKKVLACLVASVLMTGCASIVSESNYPVSISSSPSNAHFVITDKQGLEIHTGKTPATVLLKSGAGYFSSASYTLTIKKDGFENKKVVITGSMDGWYLGNILIGGLIGMLIVDPITGAMWKLPENQSVSLDERVVSSTSQGHLKVVSIDSIPETMKSTLIEVK